MSNLTVPQPDDNGRNAIPGGGDLPARMVDAYWRPWRMRAPEPGPETDRAAREGTAVVYDGGRTGTPPGPLGEIEQRVGPLRPVIPPRTVELSALESSLTRAGRRALPTLCAALHHVALAYLGGLPDDDRARYGDCLTAANPGSRASQAVQAAAWKIGANLAATRVDERALAVVTTVLREWVIHPTCYTEVAANLSHVLGRVVDRRGGYRNICDQWLLENPLSDIDGGALRAWACASARYRTGDARWHTVPVMIAVNPARRTGTADPGERPAPLWPRRAAAVAQTLADAVTDPTLFPASVRFWPMYAELWCLPAAAELDADDDEAADEPCPAAGPVELPVVLACTLHADASGFLTGDDAGGCPPDHELVTAARAAMAAGLHAAECGAVACPDGEELAVMPITPEEFARAHAASAGTFISGVPRRAQQNAHPHDQHAQHAQHAQREQYEQPGERPHGRPHEEGEPL